MQLASNYLLVIYITLAVVFSLMVGSTATGERSEDHFALGIEFSGSVLAFVSGLFWPVVLVLVAIDYAKTLIAKHRSR